MNQERFIRTREAAWNRLEQLLEPKKKKTKSGDNGGDEFPGLYREVCHDLALARSRMYSRNLTDRLNHLVARGHQQLYEAGHSPMRSVATYIAGGFAQRVRQQWPFVLASAALLYLPFLIFLAAIQIHPDFVYTVLDGEEVRQVESMYNPTNRNGLGRDWERRSDTDLMMFGYYIKNNTGIGFRTFAGGLLGGIGTLFFLVFNGIFFGAVAGHLTQIGYTSTFWSFVSGHSHGAQCHCALGGGRTDDRLCPDRPWQAHADACPARGGPARRGDHVRCCGHVLPGRHDRGLLVTIADVST